jgi:hypothetical protein
MKKTTTLIMTLLVIVACDESVEDPGCDLFIGSATVVGVARDIDGEVMADAEVEFTISNAEPCVAERRNVIGQGRTDADGRYEVLLKAGNIVGEWCVFGWVVRSDSVSTGRVKFTSDCRRNEPVDEVELDLVATPSAMIPEDLVISLYRLHGLGHGPHYSVAVDAAGNVHYQGIDSVAVLGQADTTVAILPVARLYRDFVDIGYWNIKEIYDREDDCTSYSTDIHYASTSVVANGVTKRVIHDHGCRGITVLDSLTRLECKIDSVLCTERWLGQWSRPCR